MVGIFLRGESSRHGWIFLKSLTVYSDYNRCIQPYILTKFFRGVLGRKWKSPRKIFGAPPARKKGIPKFFACGGLFFVVEPLKTVNFSNFFPKTVKFLKKGTPKIFRLRRAFFQKSPRSILRKSSVKVGGVKNILHPPPLWRGMLQGTAPKSGVS